MPETLTVVIASPLEDEHLDRIRAVDPRIEVLHDASLLPTPNYIADHKGSHPVLDAAQQERWRGMLARADVLFDFDWFEPSLLRTNAPRATWVQATSSGLGQVIARNGFDPQGLLLTTAAGVHSIPLAEFAVTGILYFVKELPLLQQIRAERRWEQYTARQLAGMNVMVVGLGSVGRRTVASLSALGVAVTAVGRDGREYDVPTASRRGSISTMTDLLPSVDAVVLCCPLTDETRGLFGAEQFAALPEGAILVNIARGGVVDEPAMLDALTTGRLGGAALDVFATEPLPSESPFWQLENVIVSPHSASTVSSENHLITDIFVENLRRRLDGRDLVNVYDVARGY